MEEVWGLFRGEGKEKRLEYTYGVFSSEDTAYEFISSMGVYDVYPECMKITR